MAVTPTTAFAVLFSASAFAQPIEANLDHVVIAVHGLETAKRVYSELGFAVTPGGRFPDGTQNAVAGFSGGGYLELLSLYDATMPGASEIVQLLEHGEGAFEAGLQRPDPQSSDLRKAALWPLLLPLPTKAAPTNDLNWKQVLAWGGIIAVCCPLLITVAALLVMTLRQLLGGVLHN